MSEAEAIQTFFTRYEAGLLTGTEYKIRWSGGTTSTQGPITFPCAMSEGMVIRIMESPKEAQIASAGEIAMEIGQLSGFHNITTVVLLLPV